MMKINFEYCNHVDYYNNKKYVAYLFECLQTAHMYVLYVY